MRKSGVNKSDLLPVSILRFRQDCNWNNKCKDGSILNKVEVAALSMCIQ